MLALSVLKSPVRCLLVMGLALTAACSSDAEPSSLDDVEDVRSMSVRPDGRFDVVCKNGRTEVRDADEIRAGLVCEGGGGGGGGGGGNGAGLLCVARDNDGQAPWLIARISPEGNVARLPGTEFSDLEQCRGTIRAARPFRDSVAMCVARDNDGRDPWIIALVSREGTLVRAPDLIYGTLLQCQDVLNAAQPLGDSLSTCASRDRDGKDPWVVATLAADGRVTLVTALLYNTLPECQAALGAGHPYLDALLLCVARDNDGRDPWIVGRFSREGILKREPAMVFATIDQCHASLDGARHTGQVVLACASRDADGRDPWNVFRISQSAVEKTTLSYGTINDCVSSLGG